MTPLITHEERVEIRVTTHDLTRWRARANEEGVTLSNWIRLVCNMAPPTKTKPSKKGGK